MIARLRMFLALLVLAGPAWAEGSEDGLPADGTAVTLKPTPTGYEASIAIPRSRKLTDAKVTSTDATLQALLEPRIDKEEDLSRPPDATHPADATVKDADPPADAGKPTEKKAAGKANLTGKAGAHPVPAPAPTPSPKPGTADKTEPPRPPVVKLVTLMLKSGAIRQGAYPFTLILTSPTEATIRDLSLVVPAASIDAPDTLIVVNEKSVLGQAGATWPQFVETVLQCLPDAITSPLIGHVSANQPQIWETTRSVWLTDVTLDQKGDTDANGEPAGRIKVRKPKLANIPPGQGELIRFGDDFVLDGNFPLGTVKGRLIIQADQLATPVLLNFEIRSKIAAFLIFVPLLAGLGCGYLTRTLLTNRLKLNQEKQKTFALMEMIDEGLARNGDAKFQQAAKDAKSKAEQAANMDTDSSVNATTTQAQADYQKALDVLTQSRADLDRAIAPLLALLGGGYCVPSALGAALAQARTEIDDGLPGLKQNDVGTASSNLDRIRIGIGQVVQTSANRWLGGVEALGAAIDDLAPILHPQTGDELRAKLKTIRDPVRTALSQLEAGAPTDHLKAALESLHNGAFGLESLLAGLALALQRRADRWKFTLDGVNLPKREVWTAWLKSLDEQIAALRKVVAADAGGALQGVDQAFIRVVELLKRALEQQAATPDDGKAIEVLLKADRYGDAVAKVAELNAPGRPIGGVGVVKGRSPGAVAGEQAMLAGAAVEPLYFGPANTPISLLTYGFAGSIQGNVTTAAVLAAMSRRSAEATSFMLWVIYALLIAGSGYFLFADKWVGTPLDFATVFFWAFATDVGADAATTAAKGLKQT